ncbi:MAG: hypothetical protein K6E10_11725 [Eubacterium sp.]|nr:hypothetical protein [Eubacterium sp.]
MKNKKRVMRNMLVAMFGAVLCIVASYLSSAYGEGNVKNGLIQSNWIKMSYVRLEVSLILSSLGIGLMYPGIRDYIKVVKMSINKRYALEVRMTNIFEMGMAASLISYLFIQAGNIMIAIVYKELFATSLMGADIISVTEGMFYYIAIPLFTLLVMGIGFTSISYMYLIYSGRIKTSGICMFLNPLLFFALGQALKLVKIYYISDIADALTPLGYLMMFAVGMLHVAKMPVKRRQRR